MALFGKFLVSGLLLAALAFPVHAAQAQWRPFGGLFGGGDREDARPDRSSRPDRHLPPTSQYPLLSQETDAAVGRAIQQYQQIVSAGGWRAIPNGPALKYGMRDRRVAALRQRLIATGDLDRGNPNSPDFDESVKQGLIRFQTRHGLTPSGDVNRFTMNALNVSARQRLSQLHVNRKRLRQLLGKTGSGKYIVVNIPGYELQAVSGGQLGLTSRVVVGKPATPTPEVSASVRAVNFLPYWHVPESIAKRALIPAVKKDPQYLKREHIRVYASWGGAELNPAQVNWWSPQGERLVFRQDPGPHNALGLIRLDMPNRHIVYMHDTPLKKLFKFHLRPYSAGCVRVERVQDVAAWLLGWNPGQIDRAVQSGQQQTVNLQSPVPVYFIYLSAWASGDGVVRFRTDIYDKDGSSVRTAQAAEWSTEVRKIEP